MPSAPSHFPRSPAIDILAPCKPPYPAPINCTPSARQLSVTPKAAPAALQSQFSTRMPTQSLCLTKTSKPSPLSQRTAAGKSSTPQIYKTSRASPTASLPSPRRPRYPLPLRRRLRSPHQPNFVRDRILLPLPPGKRRPLHLLLKMPQLRQLPAPRPLRHLTSSDAPSSDTPHCNTVPLPSVTAQNASHTPHISYPSRYPSHPRYPSHHLSQPPQLRLFPSLLTYPSQVFSRRFAIPRPYTPA